MNTPFKNLRTFIGSKDYKTSQSFYQDLGFELLELSEKLSLVKVNENMIFHLQDFYVKDWLENSMMMLVVEDLEACWAELQSLNLDSKYEDVRLAPIQEQEWGKVCYLHDPAGVLWHICEFS
ncbi:MAG: glyoxalase [Bacteroidota bacterium]